MITGYTIKRSAYDAPKLNERIIVLDFLTRYTTTGSTTVTAVCLFPDRELDNVEPVPLSALHLDRPDSV